MQHSAFLLYVLSQAEALVKESGKQKMNSNYFLMALLDIFSCEDVTSQLPAEAKDDYTKEELEATIGILLKSGISADFAKQRLKEAIDGDPLPAETLQYTRSAYDAEMLTIKNEWPVVTVGVYLSMIFARPSDAIKDILSKASPSEPIGWSDEAPTPVPTPGGASAEGEGETDVFARYRARQGKDGDKTPVEPVGADDSAALSGPQKVARLVTRAKHIQQNLLSVIYGQDYAVNAFVSGYFQAELTAQIAKNNTKPMATFLFAGPPGVGKTFLAEKAAEELGFPFKRFDMSEYSDKEANLEFCGSDSVYKNAHEGNVTGFVAKHPRCVLLFDEVEKAHLNVIHLFLQLMDAGRLRDNFTDKEVSFADAILIFTTNAGRSLYEDPTVVNLSGVSKKQIMKALSADRDPFTGASLFPGAICSRFASGNVVMFNHLSAHYLQSIVARALHANVNAFINSTGIAVEVDPMVSSAILLTEGGKADARTVKGRANAFFHDELYELLRLMNAEGEGIEQLKQIDVKLSLPADNKEIRSLFINASRPEILMFTTPDIAVKCSEVSEDIVVHCTDSISVAKEILFNNDISIILCDVRCNEVVDETKSHRLLNLEDINSAGRDFMEFVVSRYDVPLYLLERDDKDISQEEFVSFARMGARGKITIPDGEDMTAFEDQIIESCSVAYQQNNLIKLAKTNRVLSFKTSQRISEDGTTAEIELNSFALSLATDSDEAKSIVSSTSKPTARFADVIGAEDAKTELSYFVEYLKNPVAYMRRGVRAPKGVLLYGPPGTGKTLLAKAMAGESDVTFLAAEGNQFLKKYVGEGPEALHNLFRTARKFAPAIVFIDEIDAIAKDRSDGAGRSASDDVLTALLTEMDGFRQDTTKPVFVLAATNYGVDSRESKSLDPALLRRFDRRIYVDLPNKEERRQYILMQLEKNPILDLSAEQVTNIADRSTGMSLADLASIIELAIRNAIRTQNNVVNDKAFDEAFETISGGEQKHWDAEELESTARHEAGHALICWLSGEVPSYLTIIARGNHGGYMQHANAESKGSYTREELLSRIRISMAGRAAEMVYYGEEKGLTTGASSDIHHATRVAESLIMTYGMDSEAGLSYVDPRTITGEYFDFVHQRVNAILKDELARAMELIGQHRDAMDALVAALVEKNHLKGDEIDSILRAHIER